MLLLLPVIMYCLDLMAGTVSLSAFTGQTAAKLTDLGGQAVLCF